MSLATRSLAAFALALALIAACHPRANAKRSAPAPARKPKPEAVASSPPPRPREVPIWPGAVPDAQRAAGPETGRWQPRAHFTAVSNVSRPTMTVYSPKGKNTGAAVVVFPGGGFQILAIDLEGADVCDWLVSEGITCVLLKYRVPNSGPHWDNKCKCPVRPKAPMALEDAQRTLGLVRLHAAKWHVDPHKVGVLGFSAGGYLVAATSTHFEKRAYRAVDAADAESCRPDFAVALYPGHLCSYPGHECAFDDFALNPAVHVTGRTPPTFLLQAENDPVDSVQNSLVYFAALKKAGVPAELHIYARGKHAFGLGRRLPPGLPISHWPRLLLKWLHTVGMTAR